jgi:gluconolactonase
VAGVPPPDAFNMNNGTFGNIEGPVWIGDALYVSEMSNMAYDSQNSNVKMSRILKVTTAGETTIEIADSGSNGHAVDPDGNIVAAVHKDGSLTRYGLPGGTPATPLVTGFMNARFNAPNDVAIHTNGTMYFTDPNFQAPNNLPQAQTRAYRIAPGGSTAEPIPNAQSPDQFGNPNGITLSLDEDYLYVAASNGRRYPVMADGTLGAGENFAAANGGDGMVIDCAGNLYVAKQGNVEVYRPDGSSIGNIPVPDVQSVTNVAFGGTDHQMLYITGLGNNKGLFQKPMNLPGRPY